MSKVLPLLPGRLTLVGTVYRIPGTSAAYVYLVYDAIVRGNASLDFSFSLFLRIRVCMTRFVYCSINSCLEYVI